MQQKLEEAITAVTGETVTVLASGRTDAGAHARRQVISFQTRTSLPATRLLDALNAHLPRDIAVTSVRDVAPDFHPRYSAVGRSYQYWIWNNPIRSVFYEGRAAHVRRPLDVLGMQVAARALVGQHDVSSFVSASARGSRIRTICRAEVRRDGDLVVLELDARSFMKYMVRSIAGTLIAIGLGQMPTSTVENLLATPSRENAGTTAPACGLYLTNVIYPVFEGPTEENS